MRKKYFLSIIEFTYFMYKIVNDVYSNFIEQ